MAATDTKEQAAATDRPATATATAQRKPWPIRLYLGEIGYDFIGKRKIWYVVSAVVILICLASMIFKQFNLGVEFAGGERFRSPGSEAQLGEVTQAVEDAGAEVTSAQAVGDNQLVIITPDLSNEQGSAVSAAIADTIGVQASDVTNTTTSASWGRDVTSKAVQGLLVFLVLVLVFLAVRFQPKMAAGAMVALVHDLVITAGVYSLVGFEVTPASVIGLLTILGFSLYDTVVVFDKIDENAKGLLASQRRTYSQTANLAINQVLMRSINTSIFALLPVLGLLYAGVFLIGEGTLQDLALVLFVGLLAGIYSSIFLAAPVLCDLKEREPDYRKLTKRVQARQAGTRQAKRGSRKTPRASKTNESDIDDSDIDDSDIDDSDIDDSDIDDSDIDDSDIDDSDIDDSDIDDSDIDDSDIDDSDIDDGEIDGGDDSDSLAGVAARPGTVVASARRSRPRTTTRPAIGATAASKTATPGKAANANANANANKAGKPTPGSQLAPRPGAKPSRPRARAGSNKRKR